MPFSRWGTQLEGDFLDLSNLAIKLNESFNQEDDFYLEVLPNLFILRTKAWDLIESDVGVLERASASLQIIYGCLKHVDGATPITPGAIFEYRRDGTRKQTRLTTFTIAVRKDPRQFGTPTSFRKVLEACEQHPNISDCLTTFGLSEDWFHIYKAIEALEIHYGGEEKLISENFADKALYKKLKRTANSFRHAKRKSEPDQSPINLDDARKLTREIIQKAVSQVVK